MDEELNQEQEQQQQSGNGGKSLNPATNVANKAKNVQNVATKGSQIAQNQAAKLAQNAAKKTGVAAAKNAKRSQRMAKAAENLAKVAQKAGKVANVATKFAAILGWIAVIILVLLVIIAIIVFLITGLGFIMSGLKEIADSFLDVCMGVVSGSENNVGIEEISDTLSYLDEMSYDIYGYGFVTEPEVYETTVDDDGNKIKSLKTKDVDSDAYKYITSYLVSDKYAYTIKNNNKNFKAAFDRIDNLIGGFFGNSTAWGSGLIAVFHEENGKIGSIGNAYGLNGIDYVGLMTFPFETIIANWDTLTSEITVEDGTLKINNPGLGTPTFTYELDGWTGRYSMPLEFLLSTHLATMAPDLSYKMATSFDTTVEILLHQAKGEEAGKASIDAKVEISDGNKTTTITKSEFNSAVIKWGWNWAEVASISKKDALQLIVDLGINTNNKSGVGCQSPETGLYATSSETTVNFVDYVNIGQRWHEGYEQPDGIKIE